MSAVALWERERRLRGTNGKGRMPATLTVIMMQSGEIVGTQEAAVAEAMAPSVVH